MQYLSDNNQAGDTEAFNSNMVSPTEFQLNKANYFHTESPPFRTCLLQNMFTSKIHDKRGDFEIVIFSKFGLKNNYSATGHIKTSTLW